MKWRELVEESPLGTAGADSGGLVFGDSATEAEITKLELELGVRFPQEFREIYSEFDGVGPRYSDEEIAWWLLPSEKIASATKEFQGNWFDDARSALLAKQMVVFGSWFNGDVFGYVRDDAGAIRSAQIYQYDHEEGYVDEWDKSLEHFLADR